MERDDRANSDKQSGGDEWERVERTSAFGELTRRKKAFIIPAAIFLFAFVAVWIILGQFTTLLDGQAVGAMTWASVYGFAQFVMPLILLHLYMGQAKKWDSLAEEARREASEGGGVA